jgi:hypothetical protein
MYLSILHSEIKFVAYCNDNKQNVEKNRRFCTGIRILFWEQNPV